MSGRGCSEAVALTKTGNPGKLVSVEIYPNKMG